MVKFNHRNLEINKYMVYNLLTKYYNLKIISKNNKKVVQVITTIVIN